MIERFNFYDVYGYLLPGLALIGVIWLPFGLLSHSLPSNELLSAVLVLAFGYVLGHLLQGLLTTAMRSDFNDSHGRKRKPGDIALDQKSKGLSDESRAVIVAKVLENFNIDLRVGSDGEKKLSERRNAAFFMVRAMLIQQKLLVYGEQFQGMYAMMRGLSMCCFLGFLYLSSWAASAYKNYCLWILAIVLCSIAVGTMLVCSVTRLVKNVDQVPTKPDTVALSALGVASISIGYVLGYHENVSAHFQKTVFLVGLLCLFAGLRFLIAYRFFAFEFARSVWRDFAAIENKKTDAVAV